MRFKLKKLVKKKINLYNDLYQTMLNAFYQNIKHSKKLLIFSNSKKIFYINFMLKNKKKYDTLSGGVAIIIVLEKKQTYINILKKNKKIFHLTNGIVLKKKKIFEKFKKKDNKNHLITTLISVDFLKKQWKELNENLILINIKKTKPILSKIYKYVVNGVKKIKSKNIFILTPLINFNKSNFKKIKSIKRRLRKRYVLLDV